MPCVLITGATGFIGGHLVEANLTQGKRVRCLVSPNHPRRSALIARGAEVVLGDIRDPASLHQAVQGADIVFHCAAVVSDWAPKRLFEEVTIGGAENICRAAADARITRLVDISTNDVFGLDESRILNERCPFRPWGEPYPDAKIAAEKIMWRWYRESGVPLTIAYPCWVYGAGDRTFIPRLTDAIDKRKMVFWRKDVLVWPTYIENLVDLLMQISEDDAAIGNGYLVHDGESTTLQALCGRIADALGTRRITTRLPYGLVYAAAVAHEGLWRALRRETRPLITTYAVKNLGSRLRFSLAKAQRDLGWMPRVSHAEGLSRTLACLPQLERRRVERT